MAADLPVTSDVTAVIEGPLVTSDVTGEIEDPAVTSDVTAVLEESPVNSPKMFHVRYDW